MRVVHQSRLRHPRSAAVVAAGLTVAVAAGTFGVVGTAVAAPDPSVPPAVTLSPLGTYSTGQLDESAAEIVAFHAASTRLFVVNAQSGKVDVLDARDPSAPTRLFELAVGGTASADDSVVAADAVVNSVAIRPDGLAVAAVESGTKTDDGWLVLFDAAAPVTTPGAAPANAILGAVRVGALPDMVTFSPDGSRIAVANEGEPADDYSVDPEGSVSIVAAPANLASATQADVRTATFHAFEAGGTRPLPAGVRVFGGREAAGTGTPERPVSENLEPEYIAWDATGTVAYASVQEANALAVVDVASATVTDLLPLGTQDHLAASKGLDASDKDGRIDIRAWPVKGLYQPDTIASYQAGGATYLVTANEGDSRDWAGYSEVKRVKDLGKKGVPGLCADAFSSFVGAPGNPATLADLTADSHVGRLNVSTASGLRADGSCYEELYSYGSRSFSIWSTDGRQVFDSGDAFEQLVASVEPDFFNSNHTESGFDGRSDDKGPEPEGLTLGEVGGRTYAFIGFERVGGIAVYDVTDPAHATYVSYVNHRDFSVSAEATPERLAEAGDLGPEGLTFVPASDSPTGAPLLAVGNEISGTTTFYGVDVPGAEPDDGRIDLTVTIPAAPIEPGEFVWTVDGGSRVVDLGTARLAGDHLAATGRLSAVTVTDTRATAPAWSVSAQVDDFTSGAGAGARTLPGKHLGWTPSLVTAGGGTLAGAPVASGLVSGNGLADSALLGSAAAGHELGSAVLGADLDLRFPVDAAAGTYTATLTLTAIG
ncbi:choice-of-anchor I family protein [Oerskovia sp. NPDC056781]|uniref:choice-of-anchor I family protein n=1 Tax=Oerskovia sp. NPDC056781 TaxID=3345942 RepID=UPI0036708A6D